MPYKNDAQLHGNNEGLNNGILLVILGIVRTGHTNRHVRTRFMGTMNVPIPSD